MIDLTIRVLADPAADAQVFRLVADDGQPAAGTTVPDAAAALEAVEKFGQEVFFPQPGPPRLCTQHYGAPQVAEVSGIFHGRRTAGCTCGSGQAVR